MTDPVKGWKTNATSHYDLRMSEPQDLDTGAVQLIAKRLENFERLLHDTDTVFTAQRRRYHIFHKN